MNLTPKQIQALRIAVAEVDGWKDITCDMILLGTPPEEFAAHHDPAIWSPDDGNHLYEVSNYPESLDAVHEMEQALTDEQWDTHWKNLNQVVEAVKVNETYACWQSYKRIYGATALHRCIAILMTLNPEKWLEIQNLKD